MFCLSIAFDFQVKLITKRIDFVLKANTKIIFNKQTVYFNTHTHALRCI